MKPTDVRARSEALLAERCIFRSALTVWANSWHAITVFSRAGQFRSAIYRGTLAMSITQVDRTRVSLAAAISMILAGAQVNAQEAQKSELEEVVVTGSFIRGTPEDSAMPVEVVSFEEIQNMGRPSNLDLIKTM